MKRARRLNSVFVFFTAIRRIDNILHPRGVPEPAMIALLYRVFLPHCFQLALRRSAPFPCPDPFTNSAIFGLTAGDSN